jgi:hypothetical protein
LHFKQWVAIPRHAEHLLSHGEHKELTPSSKYPDSQSQLGAFAALFAAHFKQNLGVNTHVLH